VSTADHAVNSHLDDSQLMQNQRQFGIRGDMCVKDLGVLDVLFEFISCHVMSYWMLVLGART
jgi:hypothetical protein